MNILKHLLAVFALFAVATPVVYADYPDRPIRLIVGFAPGAGTDLIARILAEQLSKELKQTVFVENKAGADGYIGSMYVANAEADGYTMLLAPTGTFVSPLLKKRAGYDPVKSFSPIARVGKFHSPLLVVSSNSKLKTIDQLLEALQTGQTFYGTGNITGMFAAQQLKEVTKSEATQISYKGEGDALRDLAAGRVSWMFALPTAANTFIQNGSVHVIATSAKKRSAQNPDTPSLTEASKKEMSAWEEPVSLVALLAPIGMKPILTSKIAEAVSVALGNQQVKERLERLGFSVLYENPQELAESIGNYVGTWKKAITQGKIPIQE